MESSIPQMEAAAASERSEGEEPSSNPKPTPLFPLSSTTPGAPLASSADPQWLSNSSFTLDVSGLSTSAPAAASPSVPPQDAASSDSDAAPAPEARPPSSYDLVPSSPSSSSSDRQLRPRRREKTRRKRKREGDRGELHGGVSRKSGVRAWEGSDTKPAKDYYVDARGDKDNLAFGSLYRMDIARHKLHSLMELSGLNFQVLHRRGASASSIGVDADVDGLDSKVRAGGRYYSVKYATLERNKSFKHWKMIEKKMPLIMPEEYIPLESPPHENTGNMSRGLEESWEEEFIRRTREFNKMSREFPHDQKVWLAFAEYQDKIASTQPQKAARLQTIERKISILEKAVELNPNSEELLLCLLESYRIRDSTENLLGKWEKILTQHSDSCRLWKEYLLFCQGEFSQFKVSEMRRSFALAIQALSAACYKLCKQDSHTGDLQLPSSLLIQLELGLVDVFINLCRFEWQTGYRELATGLFQAQIEYSSFCPTLYLTPSSKRRLFEHFWNNGAARIGEDGALGWSMWLAKDEENRQSVITHESSQESEVGGWSGWFNPSKQSESNREPEKLTEDFIDDEHEEENLNTGGTQTQDDIEALLEKLGIDVNADSNSEVKDAKIWNRWSVEESSRDNEQWLPIHEHSASLQSGDELVQGGNEQLSRVILFDDVADYLFSLSSEESRFSLICQFIDFYGGKVSNWTSTNNASWIDGILSWDIIPEDILEDLKFVSDLFSKTQTSSSHLKLESILGVGSDCSTRISMIKFLRNAILLCLDVFPRNHKLQEAILIIEELFMGQMNSSSLSCNASRALAKSLLKKDRQDILLCGLYARQEAIQGNIDVARKIFDMALVSVDSVAKDLQDKVPLLYFWYAEMEMTPSTLINNPELCLQRAIHILSCLGSNIKYSPFKGPISGPQILRARQGFKEQIKNLRVTYGAMKEHSIPLISSASLFESMTSSLYSGLEVIEEAFSMVLPERRTQSLALEFLWIYYVRLILKHLKNLMVLRVWRFTTQGMEIYPYNPKSYTAMLALSSLYSVAYKVRLMFDKCCKRNPSVIVWLFSLFFEWNRDGSCNRIHGLFERALANSKLQKSVLLWRCYLAFETDIACDPAAARRVFFRAIHACPWSKRLWLEGFQKLSSILTLKELADLQEVMRDKEINMRTDIYEILLQEDETRV